MADSEGVGSGVMQCIGMDKIILNRLFVDINMSARKELGQIHVVEQRLTNLDSGLDGNAHWLIDLPGTLTTQLQRMVRQGQYFKLVGIDMNVTSDTPTPTNGGRVAGYFRYYAPTQGRCAAYRHAFKSMADMMKIQGISMRDNAGYDFRASLTQNSTIQNNLDNQATLDGISGLALNHASNPGASIFGVYNESITAVIDPLSPAKFSEGFDTILQNRATGTDFVLNDAALFSGNELEAGLAVEKIPFQLQFSDDSSTATFQFRPDPALYIAVMCGLLEIVFDTVDSIDPTGLELNMSFQVAGWKSIMSTPKALREKRS